METTNVQSNFLHPVDQVYTHLQGKRDHNMQSFKFNCFPLIFLNTLRRLAWDEKAVNTF